MFCETVDITMDDWQKKILSYNGISLSYQLHKSSSTVCLIFPFFLPIILHLDLNHAKGVMFKINSLIPGVFPSGIDSLFDWFYAKTECISSSLTRGQIVVYATIVHFLYSVLFIQQSR